MWKYWKILLYKWCGIAGLASTVQLNFSMMLYVSMNLFRISCVAFAVMGSSAFYLAGISSVVYHCLDENIHFIVPQNFFLKKFKIKN